MKEASKPMVPLGAMFGPREGLPYVAAKDAQKARRAVGVAATLSEWVEAVALARSRPTERSLSFVQMVTQLAEERALDKYAPFLPTDDDRLTAKEVARGEYPSARLLATTAYGYAYLTDDAQKRIQRKVAFYLANTDTTKERDYYNALCDLNPPMARVLRMRWRKANGVPEDALPSSPADRLAATMTLAQTARGFGAPFLTVAATDDEVDPFGGIEGLSPALVLVGVQEKQ